MQQIGTRLLVEETRSSALPKKVVYILVQLRTSPCIVRWAFLLFVFTIPFEAVALEALPGASTLSRLAGLFFFSTCLFYPKVCFRHPPQALWWFAGYAVVFGVSGSLIPEKFLGVFIEKFKTLIQLLVLCWVGSTLLQEEKFARHTLLTLAVAVLLVAIGMLLRFPGFVEAGVQGRLTVSGFNPNGLAAIIALGTQALIWFGIQPTLRRRWMRVVFLTMSLFSLMAMVYTGSRAAIIAFVIGVALYALPYRGSKRKMIAILGVTITVFGIAYSIVNNESAASRFKMTYETGSTAGRDKIFPAAVAMIAEKPLLGWGPVVLYYELGARLGLPSRDAHNLFLHLLAEGGLLRSMPFFIGLTLCVRAAWTARVHNLGLLPLVWLATVMVGGMAGTPLTTKRFWLVLALSLASEASTVKQSKRKNFIDRIVLKKSLKTEV